MKTLQPAYITGILVAVLAILGCNPGPQNGSSIVEPLDEPPAIVPLPNLSSYTRGWWQERFAEKCAEMEQRGAEVQILLIGDSILHYLENTGQQPYAEFLQPYGVINFGFSSDRTEHALWRLKNAPLESISPRAAVVLIGTNNTGQRNDSASDVLRGIQLVCEEVTTRLPSTQVILLHLLPKGRDPAHPARLTDQEINQSLAVLAEHNPKLSVVDFNHVFLDQQNPLTIRRDLMPDYLHPNAAGYHILLAELKTYLLPFLSQP
ncbi:MAG: GDSL-type esterase/lipase family protein [Puniceicoccaceae bacterium]